VNNFNARNTWVYSAKRVVTEFGALGITLPKPVTDAVAVMARIEADKPSTPSPSAIREAIIRGADQTEIERLLLLDLGATRLSSEWTQARTDSAGAVLAAVRAAEPTLLPALRKLADEAIGKLRRIADLGGVKLADLIRAGRESEAKLLADVDLIAAGLSNLYQLRDEFLIGGGGRALIVNGVSCATWRDPGAANAHARGKTVAEQYIAGLAAGVPLWFPSPAEAIEAATAIAAKRAADAERKREREFGQGSVVFMGN